MYSVADFFLSAWRRVRMLGRYEGKSVSSGLKGRGLGPRKGDGPKGERKARRNALDERFKDGLLFLRDHSLVSCLGVCLRGRRE